MLEQLKKEVWRANLQLVAEGLVLQSWGNVSGIDRQRGLVVIKPSGVPYEAMKPQQMVVVALETGNAVEGALKSSSDTPTHLVLYRAFPDIGGVVHTHSLYATAWAQARRAIPAHGTTHADFCLGDVPCTRLLTPKEIKADYEANAGHVIVETFRRRDSRQQPAVLVAGHGPFTWGANAREAVHNAAVLEFVARLAIETLRLNPNATPLARVLLEKHFFRKHGPAASYGQIRG